MQRGFQPAASGRTQDQGHMQFFPIRTSHLLGVASASFICELSFYSHLVNIKVLKLQLLRTLFLFKL